MKLIRNRLCQNTVLINFDVIAVSEKETAVSTLGGPAKWKTVQARSADAKKNRCPTF
jgi:hypothetical protein